MVNLAAEYERRADILSAMGDKAFQERGWKDGMAKSCFDGAAKLRTKAAAFGVSHVARTDASSTVGTPNLPDHGAE